jgi:glycosyltransferase involved in cell wall biosynthesis
MQPQPGKARESMKVLLSNSTDIFAGGEDYVLILAKQLRDRGHHVWVSANPGHLLLGKCEASDIPTVPLLYQGMNRVFHVAVQLRTELRKLSITVVHSNANYDRTCAAIAAAWSSTSHVAGVHSAHSIQHNITHWWRNRYGTDHFIADAEAVKEVLVHQDRIAPSRITVIPLGVEEESKESLRRARVDVRATWGVVPTTVVVGNVARLVPFKGHTHLLRAIADVVKVDTGVLFPIIGDGELLDTLQQQAQELGIERYVRFLGFRDHLEQLYPGFDIYCHSSLEMAAEAFPIAILRALATGLPVVSTRVGGIGLMVEDGVSGFLTPPGDPRALAGALVKVLQNPALRSSMGACSFDLFQKKFHARAMAERVEQVYASLPSVKKRAA